jgi:hypothetical protein
MNFADGHFKEDFARALQRAMDAGANGALSKVVSVPETAEAIKRLTSPGHSGQ